MRIIYPNGIIIECTRDEYLESIKDDQINSNKEVITAINDFESALLSKIDSLKDVSNASFLLFQKFCEEFKNFISQKTSVCAVDDLEELNNFFKNLNQGNFGHVPSVEELLHKKVNTSEQITGTETSQSEEQTVTTTNNANIQQNPEDMLEQIIYVYRSSEIPLDFTNPAETYNNPKEAANANNMTIQEFMKYLDSDTVFNGFIFMTKKRALQKSKTRKNSKSQKVYVYDENFDNERVFDSFTQASRMLAISILTIKNNMDKEKLVKHKYYFTSRKITPVDCKKQFDGLGKTEEDIPEIEKTMREIEEGNKKPYQVSRPYK